MSLRLRVAVLGFALTDRDRIESYLTLTQMDRPAYLLVKEAAAADLIVLDADDALAMHEVTQLNRVGDAILVGSPEALRLAPLGARARLLRPVDAPQVLAALDALSLSMPQAKSAPARPAEPTRKRRRVSARARLASAQSQVQDFNQSTGFSNSVLANEDRRFDSVLVVDDSEVARKILSGKLTRLGFTVMTSDNGQEALKLLGEHAFAFAFLDVSMAGMDGFELCRHVRKHPLPGYHPPVMIMVTSRTSTVDRIRGTLAGCDGFMHKPVDDKDLINTLAKFDDTFERTFEDTGPPWDR